MDTDTWGNVDVETDQEGEVTVRIVETKFGVMEDSSEPPEPTKDLLITWENMAMADSGDDMMEGVEGTDDADLGDVDLTDLLQLEMDQPDDFILFDSTGTTQWSVSQQGEQLSGLGISVNSRYPPLAPPSPHPATPPPPPPSLEIDELNLNYFGQSDMAQPDDKPNSIYPPIPDLPPSAEANVTPTTFFSQFEERVEDENEFPESEFIKTEVYITNAEWILKEIAPYQKYRCRQPSLLRTCCTVVDVVVSSPPSPIEDL